MSIETYSLINDINSEFLLMGLIKILIEIRTRLAMTPVIVVLLAYGSFFVKGQIDGESKRSSSVGVNNETVDYYSMGPPVDILYTKAQKRQMLTRSAYLTIKKWPNQTIPYTVDGSFKIIPSRMAALKQAIQDYNENTCIRLVPRTSHPNYVKFINGEGCYSYLGVNGGEQPLSFGSGCDTTRGTPVHEIMHALGFMHEQQRPDRDQYVIINMRNVKSGAEGNFQKVNSRDVDLLSYYDLNSVMHYPKWAFSSNGQNTISTRDSKFQEKIGQRRFFSPCDIAKINKFYKCGDKYKSSC